MVSTIVDVLKIHTEEDLFKALEDFENTLNTTLAPLRSKLASQVLSSDVPNMELHMTYVESWRDRVTQFLAFASAFVEHGKSTYFLLPKGKNVTITDRDAYRRKMTAGFISICAGLEELIKSIDSRVNLCKKLLNTESDSPTAKASYRVSG